jgi:hypothetical protein
VGRGCISIWTDGHTHRHKRRAYRKLVSRNVIEQVVLGCVMFILLAIGPKVRGFKPGRGRWVFKGDTNPQHVFLRKGIKPSVPCRKILRHVKDRFRCERDNS